MCFRLKSLKQSWNCVFTRFLTILSFFEFLRWFDMLNMYWLVKLYDCTSQIMILTTLPKRIIIKIIIFIAQVIIFLIWILWVIIKIIIFWTHYNIFDRILWVIIKIIIFITQIIICFIWILWFIRKIIIFIQLIILFFRWILWIIRKIIIFITQIIILINSKPKRIGSWRRTQKTWVLTQDPSEMGPDARPMSSGSSNPLAWVCSHACGSGPSVQGSPPLHVGVQGLLAPAPGICNPGLAAPQNWSWPFYPQPSL
jgi:hypothetical protein